ncbi:MAG: hypothetical protein J5833_02905 [Victivallales bacterium]|nr:hypothetical protein [Victivallales bacterium]
MKLSRIAITGLCLCVSLSLIAQDPVIEHRREYRKQLADPAKRDAAIKAGLSDKDPQIRKNALYETYMKLGAEAAPTIKALAADGDKGVQLLLLACVSDIKDKALKTELAQCIFDKTPDEETKRDAKKMLSSFNMNKKNVRLKDDPTYDHEVVTIKQIEIPDDRWLFSKDVVEEGHEKGFFKSSYNDGKWMKIKVGAWEQMGVGNYDGIGWYRIRFKAPAKESANGAELFFGAVDEVAWVWLNDKYVGQHDLGPNGWDVPFFLDITKEIKWGEENLLVVRVHDSAAAGGIWKPIVLHVLK